jgi:hypothetical protein
LDAGLTSGSVEKRKSPARLQMPEEDIEKSAVMSKYSKEVYCFSESAVGYV